MDLQWYPGHMTKAKRMMQDQLKLVDLVIEILDARIPISSRNPDLDKMGQGKGRLILLNKSDLACENETKKWQDFFEEKGYVTLLFNAKCGTGKKDVSQKIEEASKAKRERDKKRGILNRPVRAMVVGVPNVGKSTLINLLAGKAVAKTGNKPGVTKGKQWIRLNKQVELLDTPGVLWPKFDDSKVGEHLAFIGSINDNIVQIEELCELLVDWLITSEEGTLNKYYGVNEKQKSYEIISEFAKVKNYLKTGGEIDYSKACKIMLTDFRNGKIGRHTIEKCR